MLTEETTKAVTPEDDGLRARVRVVSDDSAARAQVLAAETETLDQ
jgi:hypothetical protein